MVCLYHGLPCCNYNIWTIPKDVYQNVYSKTSLLAQWLRLCASNARGMGSIAGQETKIPHVAWKRKKKKRMFIAAALFTIAKKCCCRQVASVVSNSVRPHRRQPTRLPCPWDSPGKNTGVSCHFLLQCMKVKSESEVAQSCLTLSDHTDCSPPGSSIHGIFQARVLEWGAIAFSKPRHGSILNVLTVEWIRKMWFIHTHI